MRLLLESRLLRDTVFTHHHIAASAVSLLPCSPPGIAHFADNRRRADSAPFAYQHC